MSNSFDPRPDPLGDEERTVPASPEAEHAIIGAALYDNEAYQLVEDVLKGDHFYEPLHGRIWDALVSQIRRGHRAEPVAISEALKDDEALADVGGLQFLALLVDKAPGPQDAPHYANIVAELAMRRAIIKIGNRIAAEAAASKTPKSALEQVAGAEKQLAELATSGPQRSTFERIGPIYRRQLLRSRGLNGLSPGIPMGIPSLDAMMGGLRRATMNTVAGRPGMGKSAFGIMVALNLAQAGVPVAYYSAEMPEEQVATRFGCALIFDRMAPVYGGKTSNPTYEDFEKGELTELQWDNLEKGLAMLEELPIFMDFTRPTASHITASTRRLKRQCIKDGMGEDIVTILDHMLKVKPEREGRSDPVADLTQVSNDLLEGAKSTNSALLNLMQLNRGIESRDDKRPTLSDLKQSGTIEEDSFSVSFLLRHEYYNRPPEDDNDDKAWAKYKAIKDRWARKVLFILEKNRGGRGQQQLELFCDIGSNYMADLKIENRDETGRILFPTGGGVYDSVDDEALQGMIRS